MQKWSRSLAAILAVTVLLLAGCGGQESQPNPPAAQDGTQSGGAAPAPAASQPEQKKDPVSLNIWIMPNSSQSEPDMLEVLKPFTDQNPHINVQVTVLDWGSAWTKITTAATSGEGPDVLQLGTTWVAAIAAMDALEPLTDKVNEVGGAGAFFPASWQTTGIANQDERYAVPWIVDARAIYYRKDIFAKAGIDPKEAFKDWQSFKEALVKVNGIEVDGVKVAALGVPGKNDWNVPHNVIPWVWGAGGSELTADLKSSAINSDAAVDGVMFYTGLAHEGLVPREALEKNTADVESMFHNGQLAVIFSGPWLIRHYYTPEADGGGASTVAAKHYGISPIPAGPKGRYTFYGGSHLAVFKSSRHKEEAWELIKFLLSKEAQVAYAKKSGQLPAVKAAAPEMTAFNPNYAPFYEAVEYGRAYPSIPGWGPIEGVLTKHFGMIWDITAGVSGTYSRESIKRQLDEAAVEINNLLTQQ